jgi:hypothetical protein
MMLADMIGSFLLVPFRLASVRAWRLCHVVAIVLCGTIRAWTSTTGCHPPVISTSESHNLSYKDS